MGFAYDRFYCGDVILTGIDEAHAGICDWFIVPG
jgi:hypothetical protein